MPHFGHAGITLGGLYLYRSRGKTWLFVLSFGAFTHLVVNQMWLEPRSLLCPLYGFAFERIDLTYWVQGMSILIWFILVLVRKRKVYAFIRSAQVA